MDLIATKTNRKCYKYVSRFPESEAVETDAFTISWGNVYFYVFPPVAMVLRTLRKIIDDGATGIIVVPDWPNQTWYPVFMAMLTRKPLILQPSVNSLSCPSRIQNQRIQQVTLLVGRLYGKLSLAEMLPEKPPKF